MNEGATALKEQAMQGFVKLSQRGRPLEIYIWGAMEIKEVLPEIDRAIATRTLAGLDNEMVKVILATLLGDVGICSLSRWLCGIRTQFAQFESD